MLNWHWKKYSELTRDELYLILQARERVFVVEQNCPYLDADGTDSKAWHLWGVDSRTPGRVDAYLRAFPPGVKYAEASVGRVLTSSEARRGGFGKALMLEAIARLEKELGAVAIRISAQSYLQKFYEELGFKKVSEEYLEDNIPHIEMLKAGAE